MIEGRRPTCYIHIGPHKTGSSSIQHFVRGNIEALAEHGLHFPTLADETGSPEGNHAGLATVDEIAPNGDLKRKAKLWPKIDRIVRTGETDILLSSEMFCRSLADKDRFDPILSYFEQRGYRVVILAYIRDQPAWLNSWYVQSQKRFAGLMTFDEFVEDAGRRGRVEPWSYLRPFIDEPRCELEIVPFEHAAKTGLENDFIRRCGVPADARLAQTTPRNRNAGAISVFAAQEIMRRSGSDIQDLPGFLRPYQVFRRTCLRNGWDETPFIALTDENVARIRSRYAETNESFAQRFFGVTWAELCPAKRFGTSVFDPAQASWWQRRKIDRLVRDLSARFIALREADAGAAQAASAG